MHVVWLGAGIPATLIVFVATAILCYRLKKASDALLSLTQQEWNERDWNRRRHSFQLPLDPMQVGIIVQFFFGQFCF